MNGGSVADHYRRGDLSAKILTALEAAGKDLDRLTPADIAPHDQMHPRGNMATAELAAPLDLGPGMRVLDVGCGMGGAARYLAQEFGCDVQGVDLMEEHCAVATMLAEMTGLSERVRFTPGDACNLPFPDGAFDVVWTQSASMNIADKQALYRGFARVLKPGGVLAAEDPVLGEAGPPIFPLPWAADQSTSFQLTPAAFRVALEQAGFAITLWQDTTALVLGWLEDAAERAASAPSGKSGDAKRPGHAGAIANALESFRAGRAGQVRVIARRGTA